MKKIKSSNEKKIKHITELKPKIKILNEITIKKRRKRSVYIEEEIIAKSLDLTKILVPEEEIEEQKKREQRLEEDLAEQPQPAQIEKKETKEQEFGKSGDLYRRAEEKVENKYILSHEPVQQMQNQNNKYTTRRDREENRQQREYHRPHEEDIPQERRRYKRRDAE